MDKTILVDTNKVNEKNMRKELQSICEDLKERGYNPVKQIAGYIISGDPGYISSFKECRTRVMKLDRTNMIEIMLECFLDK